MQTGDATELTENHSNFQPIYHLGSTQVENQVVIKMHEGNGAKSKNCNKCVIYYVTHFAKTISNSDKY